MSHNHIPKIIANRPGLATLKCTECGKKWLQEYTDGKAYSQIKEAVKRIRRQRRALGIAVRNGLAT